MKGVFPKQLSKDFHKTFELRQVSDYKVSQASSPEQAREIMAKAIRFVEAVATYLEESSQEGQT